MKLFGLVLALTVLFSILGMHESFAEYVPSSRQQLKDGVAPEDIQCKENRVLVLRTNGNIACMSEKGVEKMGWEIIETTPSIQKEDSVSYPSDNSNDVKSILSPKEQTENDFTKYQKQVEKLDGLIFPVDNKDELANKIFEYLGDEIVEKEDKDPTNYRNIFDSERTNYYGENTIVTVGSVTS